MGKGKSVYTLNIAGRQEDVERIILNFLAVNKFKMQGDHYYVFNDPMVYGYRGFEYNINGDVLTIYAHINKPSKPHNLDGSYAFVAKNAYRSLLQSLITTIASGNVAGTVASSTDPYAVQNANIQIQNSFMNEQETKNGKLAVTSFIISLVMLALSFLGIVAGALIIVLNYWMAAQGLKSKKKGLAIATMIINTIAIVIGLCFYIIYNVGL